MGLSPEQQRQQQQRIEDCRELYLKHGGDDHEAIEREMRAMGHQDFHRRSLYRRFERGGLQAGWIERFGWNKLVRNAECGVRNESHTNGGHDATIDDEAVVQNTSASPTPHSAFRTPHLEDFDDFKEWLKRVSPGMDWEYKHQIYIYKRLRKLFDGVIKRLMIFMPPRHGKSELVTKHFAAYCLKQKPNERIIIGSYNQQLANKFSRGIRNILAEDAEQERRSMSVPPAVAGGAFETGYESPSTRSCKSGHGDSTVCRCKDRNTPPATAGGTDFTTRRANSVAEWETREGGGVRAVGVGAGVTGYGANLIIIDDPTKSRAEANSATYRERVWDWFNDDIRTRLEPDGRVVLIQTRWHEDDLAGRLLKQMKDGGEQWEVISLPAVAEMRSAECGMRNEEATENWPQINADGSDADDADMKTQRNILSSDLRSSGSSGSSAAKTLPQRLGDSAVAEMRSAECGMRNEEINLQDGHDRQDEHLKSLQEKYLVHPVHPVNNSLRLCDSAVQTPGDPLGRRPGQALWPERYDEKSLQNTKRQIGSFSFASLYQQTPVPAEGGLFKRKWFKTVPTLPPGVKKKRGWDLGISKKTDADYTASAGVAYDNDGNVYIYDVIRRRIEYPEQRRLILGRIQIESDTEHGIEESANGNAVIQDLRKEKSVRASAIRGVKPKGDKITRALPWIALAEAGCVYLVNGPWNQEFIDEACSFPLGTHDDQIDAVSLAVELHRKQRSISFGC